MRLARYVSRYRGYIGAVAADARANIDAIATAALCLSAILSACLFAAF
jgi:hypothetical protein